MILLLLFFNNLFLVVRSDKMNNHLTEPINYTSCSFKTTALLDFL